jgi:deoxyribodipyrimidine photolyase-related protein
MKKKRLILGDQLNSNHSWYETVDDSITYVLMEIRTETDYAAHHIQLLGHASFCNRSKIEKHNVIYIHLNDDNNLPLIKTLIF